MKPALPVLLLSVSLASIHALDLINVDYTAHLNPNFSVKTGQAAIGISSSDFWNIYSRDVSSEFDWRASGTVENLKFSDGSSSGARLDVSNAPGAWYTFNSDPMYQSYLYPFNDQPIISQFSSLPSGTYDVYVYAHGQPAQENSILSLSTGKNSFGTLSTSASAAADAPGWTEGFEYVVFHNVDISPGDVLTLTSARDQSGISIINGVQLAQVPDGGPTWAGALTLVGFLGWSRRRRS